MYKLSSMVGRDGFATGVDWSAEYVADARRGMDHAWRKSGLPGNNMEFLQAYPEDLMAAGVGTATMDAVYINNVMTLLCDQLQVLKEIARVLKPGGLLVLETVFADRKRDEDVIEQARRLGNSIQAARTREENLTWLIAAGFDAPEIVEGVRGRSRAGVRGRLRRCDGGRGRRRALLCRRDVRAEKIERVRRARCLSRGPRPPRSAGG